MQFKKKLLVFICPAILIPVALAIGVNFAITAKKVADLQFELLTNTVNNALHESDSSFKAMDALGMAKVEFFREATQKQVLLGIQKNQTPGASLVVIDTQSNAVVFSTGDDAEGMLLSPSQIQTMIAQRSGHGEYDLATGTGDSIHAFAAFAQYRPWQWLVVSSVNRNHLYRYVFDAMVLTLAAAGVLLLVVFFVVRKLANAAGGALGALEQGAARIANNNFDVPIRIPGQDEFASLAVSFNSMAAAVKKTQASLEATFNAMPDLLFEVDAAGRIYNYHAGRRELLVVQSDLFLGKTFADIFPGPAAEVCMNALHDASIHGWATGASYSLLLPQGEAWFELSVAVMAESGCLERHYVVLARDVTKRKKAEQAVVEMNRRLQQSRQQLRQLVAQNETRLEQERRRMALEVHDELGQILTALRMDLSLAIRQQDSHKLELRTELKGMKTQVDRAIAGVRNVATSLRPVALDMGLIPALQWLCREFSRHGGVTCDFKTAQEVIALDAGRAIVFFRIVQESLTNIRKHANATQVFVNLASCSRELCVQVCDDGVGFDVAATSRNGRLGLLGMRERAIALNGRVEISSALGRGCVIDVVIPFASDVDGDPS